MEAEFEGEKPFHCTSSVGYALQLPQMRYLIVIKYFLTIIIFRSSTNRPNIYKLIYRILTPKSKYKLRCRVHNQIREYNFNCRKIPPYVFDKFFLAKHWVIGQIVAGHFVAGHFVADISSPGHFVAWTVRRFYSQYPPSRMSINSKQIGSFSCC